MKGPACGITCYAYTGLALRSVPGKSCAQVGLTKVVLTEPEPERPPSLALRSVRKAPHQPLSGPHFEFPSCPPPEPHSLLF